MAKILVVDDDPDVVMSTRLCLEAEGHEVIDAKNGTECLARVRTQCPDLIILDVMMDSTTEGFQVTLKLKSQDLQVSVGIARWIISTFARMVLLSPTPRYVTLRRHSNVIDYTEDCLLRFRRM